MTTRTLIIAGIEDPRALIQRAIAKGFIAPPPPPLTPEQMEAEYQRNSNKAAYQRRKAGAPLLHLPKHSLAPEEKAKRQRAQKAASKNRIRAELRAKGLTADGLRYDRANKYQRT